MRLPRGRVATTSDLILRSPPKPEGRRRASRRMAASSMNRRSLRLQARQQVARALDRHALMVEAQAVQPAQLLAVAGASGSAMVALRHDDAVPGVAGGDRRIDGENAPVRRAELARRARQKLRVGPEDRGDQRAAAAAYQRDR